MTTHPTTKPPSIIVKFPHAWSTIRNEPEAIWKYIKAIAPALYSAACDCKRLATRNGYTYDEARTRAACLLIVNGKVREHAEPYPIVYRPPFLPREVHLERAQVDGYSVRALRPGHRAPLYCTCHDTEAPLSKAASFTCEHILAYLLSPEAQS